jgi:hypothetical protein
MKLLTIIFQTLGLYALEIVAIFLIVMLGVKNCDATTFTEHASAMEIKHEVPEGLVSSICAVESSWIHPTAKGAHGEVGICQIKPDTVRMFCKSCETAGENLYQGQRGSSVARVQGALVRSGFRPGTIDGVFGLKTHIALTHFQKSKGLTPDGIVGPRTWRALFDEEMIGKSIKEQLKDPATNIEYAARYLAWLRDYLGTNDPYILAAAYNGGPANKTVIYMLKVRRLRE